MDEQVGPGRPKGWKRQDPCGRCGLPKSSHPGGGVSAFVKHEFEPNCRDCGLPAHDNFCHPLVKALSKAARLYPAVAGGVEQPVAVMREGPSGGYVRYEDLLRILGVE